MAGRAAGRDGLSGGPCRTAGLQAQLWSLASGSLPPAGRSVSSGLALHLHDWDAGPEWAVAAEPLLGDGARACGRPAISPLRELGYSASVPAPLPPTHVRRRYSSDPLAPAGKAGAFFALAAALCSAGIRLTPPRTMTYFKPKNMGDVRLLLGSLDDDVAVTLTPGVQLPPTVRTVGDLRRLTAWPIKHRLVVERVPFVEVRVERGRAVHHA